MGVQASESSLRNTVATRRPGLVSAIRIECLPAVRSTSTGTSVSPFRLLTQLHSPARPGVPRSATAHPPSTCTANEAGASVAAWTFAHTR